ncbi:MAG: SMP-30/gluconolactonase/LRE family protein [Cyclobacteriaceae bacterium]
MKRKRVFIFLGAVVGVLILFILNTLYSAGVFKTLKPHLEGTIKTIYTTMPGTEDMDIDYQKGLLFISANDRWEQLKGKPVEGGIYLLQLDSGIVPRKLPTTYKGVFRPHGISFFSKAGGDFLFVVNHPSNDENYVELFQFRNDTLFHQKSFSDPSMCCPNDVVGIDTDKFYVTNDHGTKTGKMRIVEDYLRIPWSYLLYYDGAQFKKAYEGLTYGNGVNVSNDGSKLYVTHTTGRELLTFSRNKETGELKLLNKLNLQSGLDNIHVDDEDNLWIACHPKMLKFIGHSKDSTNKSPSQVFKLTPATGGTNYIVEEVYLNEGEQLSGSSVAVQYKNELLVGVVFDHKVLRATLTKKP